jgi:hypothetical protein
MIPWRRALPVRVIGKATVGRGILFRGREFQEVFVERVTLEHSQDIR